MNDLISRQAVLDYIDSMPSELTNDGRRMIRRVGLTEYISDTLPSAERKGKWYAIGNTGLAACECGYITDRHFMYNFCPNCGADMRPDNAPLADDDSIYR